MRRLMVVFAVAPLLGGCHTGWPFGSPQDPNATEAVTSTEPLAEQCRHEFLQSLAGTPVVFEGGPSVTRAGTVTTIQLEATPTNPDAIHLRRYSCDFENGTMGEHGPVP